VFFVNSARIAIPAKEDYLKFTVAAGLRSTLGGTSSTEASIKVRVPDIHSGFNIEGTETELIRTQEGEPEQFLFVDTSGYAALDEIAAHLEVWLLPKDKPKAGKEEAVEDYQWEAVGEITPAILKLAQRVQVKPVEVSEGDDAQLSTRHGFKFIAQRPGFLFIKVKQGAEGARWFHPGQGSRVHRQRAHLSTGSRNPGQGRRAGPQWRAQGVTEITRHRAPASDAGARALHTDESSDQLQPRTL